MMFYMSQLPKTVYFLSAALLNEATHSLQIKPVATFIIPMVNLSWQASLRTLSSLWMQQSQRKRSMSYMELSAGWNGTNNLGMLWSLAYNTYASKISLMALMLMKPQNLLTVRPVSKQSSNMPLFQKQLNGPLLIQVKSCMLIYRDWHISLQQMVLVITWCSLTTIHVTASLNC